MKRNADLRFLRVKLADASLGSGSPTYRVFGVRSDSVLAIHIALLWSTGIRRIAFYRHIAPLERKKARFYNTCRPSGILGFVSLRVLYTCRPSGAK